MKYYNREKRIVSPLYRAQQDAIDSVCEELSLVAVRPKTHGTAGDKNTVSIFTKGDYEHNRAMDSWIRQGRANCGAYRRPFFIFTNTDSHGRGSYQFANMGKIDLRQFDTRETLLGHITLALIDYKLGGMSEYFRLACAGRTNGKRYNDINREYVRAFSLAYGVAFVGRVKGAGRLVRYSDAVDIEKYDIIVPRSDETLQKLIYRYGHTVNATERNDSISKIVQRVDDIGGAVLTWF